MFLHRHPFNLLKIEGRTRKNRRNSAISPPNLGISPQLPGEPTTSDGRLSARSSLLRPLRPGIVKLPPPAVPRLMDGGLNDRNS
jgi:hypothetical protein